MSFYMKPWAARGPFQIFSVCVRSFQRAKDNVANALVRAEPRASGQTSFLNTFNIFSIVAACSKYIFTKEMPKKRVFQNSDPRNFSMSAINSRERSLLLGNKRPLNLRQLAPLVLAVRRFGNNAGFNLNTGIDKSSKKARNQYVVLRSLNEISQVELQVATELRQDLMPLNNALKSLIAVVRKPEKVPLNDRNNDSISSNGQPPEQYNMRRPFEQATRQQKAGVGGAGGAGVAGVASAAVGGAGVASARVGDPAVEGSSGGGDNKNAAKEKAAQYKTTNTAFVRSARKLLPSSSADKIVLQTIKKPIEQTKPIVTATGTGSIQPPAPRATNKTGQFEKRNPEVNDAANLGYHKEREKKTIETRQFQPLGKIDIKTIIQRSGGGGDNKKVAKENELPISMYPRTTPDIKKRHRNHLKPVIRATKVYNTIPSNNHYTKCSVFEAAPTASYPEVKTNRASNGCKSSPTSKLVKAQSNDNLRRIRKFY